MEGSFIAQQGVIFLTARSLFVLISQLFRYKSYLLAVVIMDVMRGCISAILCILFDRSTGVLPQVSSKCIQLLTIIEFQFETIFLTWVSDFVGDLNNGKPFSFWWCVGA
jgi:hypothetical protein